MSGTACYSGQDQTTDTFEWLGPNELRVTTKAADKSLEGVLNGQRMEGRR